MYNFPKPDDLHKPYAHISNAQREILFGEDILNNQPPPTDPEKTPVFTLPLADGRSLVFDEQMLSRHLLLNGSSGCGKTNVLYSIASGIMQHLGRSDILFLFDPKGDFKREFYNPNNPDHILIGGSDPTARVWNVYEEIRDESNAKEIANMCFVGRESQHQPFFSQSASNLTSKIWIDHMRRGTGLTNADFHSFVQHADPKCYLDMIARNDDFAGMKTYLGDIDKRMSPQALGVLGYLTGMCDDLFAPRANDKQRAAFSIRQLIAQRGGKIVFMEYDISRSTTIAPLYQIWIDLAIRSACARPDNQGSVYLMLEEFSILPRITSMGIALNLGRSKGIKICAALQSTYQLYQTYDETAAQALLTGFGSYFGFQSNDPASRDYTSKRFGEVYETISFDYMGTHTPISRITHAVEDWHILSLSTGEAFCDIAGWQHPFRAHFQKWKP